MPVAASGLDILNDIAFLVVGGQLADGKGRCAVCTRTFQKCGLVADVNPTDKAKSARTGEFRIDIAHLAILHKLAAANAVFAGRQNDALGAAQTILIQTEPFPDRRRRFGGCVINGCLNIGHIILPQIPRFHGGQANADKGNQHRKQL